MYNKFALGILSLLVVLGLVLAFSSLTEPSKPNDISGTREIPVALVATDGILPTVLAPNVTPDLGVTPEPTENKSRVFDWEVIIAQEMTSADNAVEQESVPDTPQAHATKLPEYAPNEIPVGYVPIPFVAWVTFYVPEACGFAREDWSEWFLSWVEQGERSTGFAYNPDINCGHSGVWDLMAGGRNIYTDCNGSCFDVAAACPHVITVDESVEGGLITGYYIQFPNNQDLGVRRCYDVGGGVNVLPPTNIAGNILPSFDVEILSAMHGPNMSWVGSSFRDAILWVPRTQQEQVMNHLVSPALMTPEFEDKILD